MNDLANKALLVFVGGGCGSVSRFLVSVICIYFNRNTTFPWSTLIVNLVGCFCMGLFVNESAMKQDNLSYMPYFLVIGFLGGFTTFSAFSIEVMQMLSRQAFWQCLLYISFSLFGSFALIALALKLNRP